MNMKGAAEESLIEQVQLKRYKTRTSVPGSSIPFRVAAMQRYDSSQDHSLARYPATSSATRKTARQYRHSQRSCWSVSPVRRDPQPGQGMGSGSGIWIAGSDQGIEIRCTGRKWKRHDGEQYPAKELSRCKLLYIQRTERYTARIYRRMPGSPPGSGPAGSIDSGN